jgi:hypothetical protein
MYAKVVIKWLRELGYTGRLGRGKSKKWGIVMEQQCWIQ